MLTLLKKVLLNPASLATLKGAFLTTTASLLLSLPSLAQKAASEKGKIKPAYTTSTHDLWNRFDLGINGGFSVNNFISNQPHAGYNSGYTVGASMNFKAYDNLGLQLEINNLQQGGQLIRFKDDTRIGLTESFQTKNVKNSSYHLNTLEIPLLVNYSFDIKQTWTPVLYAGASYAYTYHVKENYQKTGNLLAGEEFNATVQDSQTATSYFNNSRLNLIAGASAQLPLTGRFKLTVDLRYIIGATPVRDNYSYLEKPGFGSSISANSFISRIGILLPLGRQN